MPVLDRLLNFTLPAELEAHEPPEARGLTRDGVRLLVSDSATDTIAHARFSDLPEFLAPGDLVVVNDSGTLPAELTARRADGAEFPLRLSTQLQPGLWTVEPRKVPVSAGEVFALPDRASAELIAPYAGSKRLWAARLDTPGEIVAYLLRWGRPIRYPYVPRPWPLEMYQTVYHGRLGSAEMPSAGRPFTHDMFRRLRDRGMRLATLTLHTGVSSLEQHEPPYPEFFSVPWGTAEVVRTTRENGGRVIAVGTTVVRALESVVDEHSAVTAGDGWTDLVITPERDVRVVDGLLTGFHEPQATHLAMLEAIASREHLTKAYHAAIAGRYLWHEFGDVHLIL